MAIITRKFVRAGFGISTFTEYFPAPLMRRRLDLEKKPAAAKITFTGLGFYRLFVNGREITKGLLAPYTSNVDHIVYFDEYDLTDLLREGENVVGFILGNGTRNPIGNVFLAESRFVGEPCAAFVLELRYEDGSEESIEADGNVKVHASPILYNDLRIGEIYDARLEDQVEGWTAPGFDEFGWTSALRSEMPRGDHRICAAPPIKKRKTLTAVSITKDGDGFIYDFGQNGAGLVCLRPDFEEGRTLVLEFSEVLKDGRLFTFPLKILDKSLGVKYTHQTVEYTCSGRAAEYRPSFTYEGARYVRIAGISESEATKELLTFELMSTVMEERGTFTSSDPVLNELQRITREATLSNVMNIPTDCPHREKHGWTADAAVSSVHMLMNLDADEVLTEWMNNVALAQKPDGAMPGTVPSATDWGFDSWNGPAWDAVLTEVPYRLWEIRGDTRAAAAVSSAVFRYIPYVLGRRDERGLVHIGLGDWVAPHENIKAPVALTDTIMCYDICVKGATLYRILGKQEMADFCLTAARGFRRAVRDNLIDHEKRLAAGNCQTSQAMAIYYNMFTEDEKPEALENLLRIIERDGEFLDTGVLGVRVLFRVLSDYGHSDLAYKMITRPEAPSYGNMVKRGETTLVEDFGSETERINSRNHQFLGDISAWFISYACGIRVNRRAERDLRRVIDGAKPTVPADGYNNIDVLPVLPSALGFAEASYRAPGGEVRVRLDRISGEVEQVRMTVSSAEGLYGEVFPPVGMSFDGCASYPLTPGTNVYDAFRR